MPVLERSLLDPASSVRALARHELRRLTGRGTDFAAHYRSMLRSRSGRDRATALEGLAEVATPEDVPAFREFVRHPSRRMRAAAVVGLGRCDPSGHLRELAAALADPSRKVRRAALPYARMYLGRDAVEVIRRSVPR